MVLDTIKKSRTVRRFVGNRPVSRNILESFIEAARFSPSAINAQRLRYRLVSDPEEAELVYSLIMLGGALTPEQKPKSHEHATGFIVVCSESDLDTNLSIDLGIAAQSIMLAATDHGIGGCIVRAFNGAKMNEALSLGKYKSHLVLALGYPKETVRVADPIDGALRYYRDENDVHVVPKLPVSELIIG